MSRAYSSKSSPWSLSPAAPVPKPVGTTTYRSDFGASCRCKMNEVCSIMGIPGKIGTDGSQVTDLYDAGQIKEIRDYCETDVINTYLLYLNFQLHSGSLNKDNFIKCNTELIDYLKSFKDDETKPHFKEFLEEWKKFDTRNLF